MIFYELEVFFRKVVKNFQGFSSHFNEKKEGKCSRNYQLSINGLAFEFCAHLHFTSTYSFCYHGDLESQFQVHVCVHVYISA